jgi:hypothetical protein
MLVRDHLGLFEANGFSFVEAVPQAPAAADGTDAAADADTQAAGPAGTAAEGAPGGEEPLLLAGGSLCLAAVPFSKQTQFGVEEVMELLDLIRREQAAGGGATAGGEGGGRLLRPSRLRAMLASRACRSSIMIGTALDQGQMGRVLARLAGLDAPWNCPHGRPTMRHLAALPAGVAGE